jgi:hypothetical protein
MAPPAIITDRSKGFRRVSRRSMVAEHEERWLVHLAANGDSV